MPLTALHMLSAMPTLTDWVAAQNAIYWSRSLHVPSTNPLHHLVADRWWNVWITEQYQSRPMPTYARRTLMWRSYRHAKDYNVPNMIGLSTDSYYNDQYRFPHAIMPQPRRPQSLQFLTEPYHPSQGHNRHWTALFGWSDGSLMDEVGGCGFYVAVHQPKYADPDSNWTSLCWRKGSRHLGRSFDICVVEL